MALLALGIVCLAPGAASAAEVRSFVNKEGFFPSQEAEDFGPANHYPGTINVSGVPGTVTKVSLTTIALTDTQDLDMALVGPNGAQVMLVSDACETEPVDNETWTFEDGTSTTPFVPSGTCVSEQTATFKPSNYGPFEKNDDNFSMGGPQEPFVNNFGVFKGISPNGAWKLFLVDDAKGLGGFSMSGFILSLEIEPPPPAAAPAPTIVNVPVPVPVAVSVPAPAQTGPAKTGKRAAALERCAKKKTGKARQACRVKARKLPV